MKPAAMDSERLAEIRRRITSRINCLNVVSDYIRELLADRDHQAIARSEAEARNAAVIAVMRRMDVKRRDSAREACDGATNACALEGAAYALEESIEDLRQALGLPGRWRDVCPRCGSGEGVCELWCDLEDGG